MLTLCCSLKRHTLKKHKKKLRNTPKIQPMQCCPRCTVLFCDTSRSLQRKLSPFPSFLFFLKCPYLLAGVVPPVGTCPECMVCSTIQSIKKWGARLVIAFLPVTTINLGMKKKFSSGEPFSFNAGVSYSPDTLQTFMKRTPRDF